MSSYKKVAVVFGLTATAWIAVLALGFAIDEGGTSLEAAERHQALIGRVQIDTPVDLQSA